MKIYFVSSNKHKYQEVREVFNSYLPEVELELLPLSRIEIQHEDLEYIAVSSAILIYSITRKPIIVEDAGLFIKALNGFPGPFSNYVFKTIGINGILKLMNGINLRDATFKSVMVYYDGRSMLVSRGECKGFIAYCARGNKGFGFDPIFIPEGETRTFAEMEVYEKNRLSHRGKAARNLALQIREKIIKYEVKI